MHMPCARKRRVFLSAFWRKVLAMPAGRPSYVCQEVKEELWACLALMPLLQLDLRTPCSSLATVSDASETGGGFCHAARAGWGQQARMGPPPRGPAGSRAADRRRRGAVMVINGY